MSAPCAGEDVTLSALPYETRELLTALLAAVAAREVSPGPVRALVAHPQALHLARHGGGVALAWSAVGNRLGPLEKTRLASVLARALLPLRGAEVAPLASAEAGWPRWSV